MTFVWRRWRCRALLTGLGWLLAACQSGPSRPPMAGVSMTGIDHLADHLSVQDFWVDGRSGFQAGKGGRVVCCARIPLVWAPGASVEVRWEVANWREGTWRCFRRRVPLVPYDELGRLYVHFLPDGDVRVVSSNYPPRADAYPGPHVPIPAKAPWDHHPAPPPTEHCPENQHDTP